jgi:anti-anti-sigma factor
MTNQNFSAALRLENGAPVLGMQGDINAAAETALNAAYAEAEGQPGDSITLDFQDVAYINSTGIALIVGLLARARAAHRAIVARGLTEHYREIFTITRLSDFMEIK